MPAFFKHLTVRPDPEKAEWVFRDENTGQTYRKSWWRGYFHGLKMTLKGYTVEVLD